MITTLKITTFLAALICVGLVGFVGAFGLKGDPEIEKFIAEPSFVDALKKGNSTAKTDSDEMSPLVREAQLFALRINPPPPVKRDIPKPPSRSGATKAARKAAAPPPPPPKRSSAKFKVIAMCRYEDNPDKSLALLDLPAKGLKWVRVGENVEHLVVAEITDDGVIMSDNGRMQDAIAMKETPSIVRSLLAEDAETAVPAPTGMVYSPMPTTTADPVVPKGGAAVSRKPSRKPSVSTRKPPTTRPATSRRPPRTYTPSGGAGSRTPRRAPVPTVKERKAMLDGNISEIKKLMAKPKPGTPKGKKGEEDDALSKLLRLLEKERQQINQPSKNSDASTNKARQSE